MRILIFTLLLTSCQSGIDWHGPDSKDDFFDNPPGCVCRENTPKEKDPNVVEVEYNICKRKCGE